MAGADPPLPQKLLTLVVPVIVGPTGIGKSQLAFDLARRIGGEVVVADSRQVYQRLDIATNKPSPEQRREVRYHMIDFVDPAASFNAAHYVEGARRAIDDIAARGRQPIVEGGTMLYVDALCDGFSLTGIPPDQSLRAELEQLDVAGLRARLLELDRDPGVDLQNPVRMIRAIEVLQAAGPPLRRLRTRTPPPWQALRIGLHAGLAEIDRRLEERSRGQVERGLVAETRAALESGVPPTAPVLTGIGYAEAVAHIAGSLTLEELPIAMARSNKRYARRQLRWWRRDGRVRWFEIDADPLPGILSYVGEGRLKGTRAGARRLELIPPYLFAEIDRKVRDKKRAGVDVISLGTGDPDLPTPGRIVSVLQEAAADPPNHRYPSYFGLAELRESIARWYRDRARVELDSTSEILPTLGSKDGISHVPLALVDPGDIVLAPDPGYPVYVTGAIMAGAEPYAMPLTEANHWLPDLDAIPGDVVGRARLMWLNYPNNPTAATAEREFLLRAVDFCRRHDIVLCHDAPYSEIAFDGYRPLTLFEIPGAKDIGLEFHSLSKTYNMTGWRIGWVCGRADLVSLIGQLKTNIDSGIFQAVQWAAIEAMSGGEEETRAACAVYARRHRLVADTLNGLGWKIKPPRATFYVWAPVPPGYDSIGFASHVLDEVGVNITPGVGFGPHGEGYFRLSVTAPDARLEEAMSRMRNLKL